MVSTMTRRAFITAAAAAGASVVVASAIGEAAAIDPVGDEQIKELLRLFQALPLYDQRVVIVYCAMLLGRDVPAIVKDPKAILAGRVRAAQSLREKGDRAGAARCLEGTGIEL